MPIVTQIWVKKLNFKVSIIISWINKEHKQNKISIKKNYSKITMNGDDQINIDKTGCHFVQDSSKKSLYKGNMKKRMTSLFKHSKNIPFKISEKDSLHSENNVNEDTFDGSWRSIDEVKDK